MVNRFKEEIYRGDWGEVRSVSAAYNKGLMNNGSHMLDLLTYFFGDLKVAYAGPSNYDYWSNDPSIPAMLYGVNNVPIYLGTSHASDYSHFELEIFTEMGAICMENGGAQWRIRSAISDPIFKGYKTLGSGNFVKGALEKSMLNAVENLYSAIITGEELGSSVTSALVTQELCENIAQLSILAKSSYE